MGSIFGQLGSPRGPVMTSPPRLVTMTKEAQRREIANTTEISPITILLEYGESSFELVAGTLYKAYDEDGQVSWWVNDKLVATAASDEAQIVPSPQLVFVRVGWIYPLRDLMLPQAA